MWANPLVGWEFEVEHSGIGTGADFGVARTRKRAVAKARKRAARVLARGRVARAQVAADWETYP